MSTKEEIAAAMSKAFARKAIAIADGVSVSVRELSRSEFAALQGRLFVTGDDGKPAEDDKGMVTYRPEGHRVEEWLAATLEPAYTVEELLAADWPASVKATLYNAARAINGLTIEDAAKNS